MKGRCWVLTRQGPAEGGPLEIREQIPEEPGPGELLLRVRACGVCHTDLHLVEGDLPPRGLPRVPGHQIIGTVERIGPGVAGVNPGDRVGVGWIRSTCGTCSYCGGGRENLCPAARFTGWDADGGFADWTRVPASFAFPLPGRYSDTEAAPLLCAGIIGYRSLRLAGMRPGLRLGLYGFGASAHLALQLAVHEGCTVAVVSRGEIHRRIAEELGAAWTGEPGRPLPWPPEAAVVFAPSGAVVREALRSVGPGGVVAVNAIALDALPEMPYELLYGERVLRSVANFTRTDAREFLELAGSLPLRVEREVFALEAAPEALLRLKRRDLRASAVLVP